MKLSRASIALYVGLVFLSGAALGVFGDKFYTAETAESAKGKGKRTPNPEEFRKGYLGYMKKELLLSDEQVGQLNGIMDETRALMDDLHKRQQPEQFEIQRSQQEKIRSLFDTVQREKYDSMMKNMRERERNKNKNRGNGAF